MYREFALSNPRPYGLESRLEAVPRMPVCPATRAPVELHRSDRAVAEKTNFSEFRQNSWCVRKQSYLSRLLDYLLSNRPIN